MTKQNWKLIGAVAFLVFLALGYFIATIVTKPKQASEKQGLESVTLRLSWVHDLSYGGIYIAVDSGCFTREGLDVELKPGGFGLDPIKLVGSGTDKFGIASSVNLLLARAQGVPIVAIGGYYQRNGIGFFTHKESGITTFAQFKGKRIGVQTGTDTDVLYRALLVRNSMTSDDVKEVPIQDDMTPFLTDQIDVLPGYVTNQPITLRDQDIDVNIISADTEGVNYYGQVFITEEETVWDQPDLVKRFMRGIQCGFKEFIENKGAAVDAARKWAPEFDPEVLPAIYDAAMPLVRNDIPGLPVNALTKERWRATEWILRDAGLLKEGIDVSTVYTTEFIGDIRADDPAKSD